MSRLGTIATAFVFFALSGQIAQAHMAGTPDFQITHPWAKASTNGATRAFPTISNDGQKAVTITGRDISAVFFEQAGIHGQEFRVFA